MKVKVLPLTLFVSRASGTDDHNPAMTTNHTALVTHFFY